ncbi:hypothetical protein EYF80_039885 [Liparis tanakae]|uniref:Uncharacterized protein n=1 Tax=Liparis tanakae TaxID=230148 RepID=A0A4Z2GA09_9TELE|nr:hypothetical protein EYF80_039885 [Liparis tanakae]
MEMSAEESHEVVISTKQTSSQGGEVGVAWEAASIFSPGGRHSRLMISHEISTAGIDRNGDDKPPVVTPWKSNPNQSGEIY